VSYLIRLRGNDLEGLVSFLARLLQSRGALVLYGRPGTLRTHLALRLCRALQPAVYLGAGRHARMRVGIDGITFYATTSFYEELSRVLDALALCGRGGAQLIAVDEFMANLIPYRASLRESYVARMALTEVFLLGMAREVGCKILLVCAEDYRTEGPLGMRFLRKLKPALVRTHYTEGTLVAEERDPGDPHIVRLRIEVEVEGVGSCAA